MYQKRIRAFLWGACALVGVCTGAPIEAAEQEPLSLNIVGGLGGIKQYAALEEPFWAKELPEISGGRITAIIHPFDRSGLRGQDMLQLMRLGVVPFGTAILSLVAGDEPLLNAVDLPGLSPDFNALKTNVARFRPTMAALLRERYDVELLAIYTYPAQVLFCAKPFANLKDLAGRRVRTSSVGQSEMMSALGAIPIIIPFAETVSSVEKGVVDCAVTGTLSGFEIGLSEVTTHVHAMALSWGISMFGANLAAWNAIPTDDRNVIRDAIGALERRIWDSADRDTSYGLSCNAGAQSCASTRRGKMTVVPISAGDEKHRQDLLEHFVLPQWFERCGVACERAWNDTLAPANTATAELAAQSASGLVPEASR